MPDTTTPNLGLTLPEIGGSVNTWGSKYCVNFSLLDTEVAAKAPKASPTFTGVVNAASTLNVGAGGVTTASGMYLKDDIGTGFPGLNLRSSTWIDSPALNVIRIGSPLDLNAGQMKFPAAKNPSADANTFDDYQEASYTGTATGLTTSPTATVSYTIVGNTVTLSVPAIGGTSNAATFTVTGMPAETRPAVPKTCPCRYQDNGGAISWGSVEIGATGTLTFYTGGAGGWTATGAKNIYASSISYELT